MTNIFFENNTCLSAGGGWGHNQRPDGVNGRHLMVFTNTATTSNVYVRNNIFYNATESLIIFSNASDVTKFILDYNDLYQSSGNIGTIVSTNYTTLANWRTATSQEAHSIDGNPLFNGYRIQVSSPAKDVGLDVGINYDFDNHIRTLPDLGAYEYGTWILTKDGFVVRDADGKYVTITQ
jgi:hypothetical protein